jgi:DEAD/DEAH box helicase domain-containing protein
MILAMVSRGEDKMERFVESLVKFGIERGTKVWVKEEAPQPGSFAPIPDWITRGLRDALMARGITQLYTHQAEALEAVREGKNIVVVTPAASGKTMCYNLPVLNALLEKPETRAIYLFPTKALSQDQLDELQGLIEAVGAPIRTYTYDGDTPPDAREAIRSVGQIILTNPDMLHQAILPHHTLWMRLFENLRFVVLDELHAYRGVFGSHLANVLRRLKRIAKHYGTSLQFLAASATIGNPKEHAETLIEEPVTLIDRNGAPSGKRYFILWNPPVVNEELGIRANYLKETEEIIAKAIMEGVRSITFARSRLNVEILVSNLRSRFAHLPQAINAIRGYRGGYLPRERRDIESGLRNSEVQAVISTNALELGIDIGSLEFAILAGYPGTVASTLQQWGRAGRKFQTSAALLVASSAPMDQFLFHRPEHLIGASPESARTSPDNPFILSAHLKCALFELPLHQDESLSAGAPVNELLDFLRAEGVAHFSSGVWHWIGEKFPADEISLRTFPGENVVVTDISQGRKEVIGEVDFFSAPLLLHEQAIYLHEGVPYEVVHFDYENRRAEVKPVAVEYFTDAIDYTRVKVLKENQASPSRLCARQGEVEVVRKVAGFKKVRLSNMENVGYGDVHLPEWEIPTTAFWFPVPNHILEKITPSREMQIGALLQVRYALGVVAPLLLMCDARDIGLHIGDVQANWGIPALTVTPASQSAEFLASGSTPVLFIYDAVPGGVGFSELLFERHKDLLGWTAQLISECPCASGCPACVGPVLEVGTHKKAFALALLEELMALANSLAANGSTGTAE